MSHFLNYTFNFKLLYIFFSNIGNTFANRRRVYFLFSSVLTVYDVELLSYDILY